MRAQIRNQRILKFVQSIFGLPKIEKVFQELDIDLVYFLSGSGPARQLERLNYISTVFDLCHLDEPEFPEVRVNRIFESREAKFRDSLSKAVAVIAESQLGKANLIRRYALDEGRVRVIPLSPARATLGNPKFEDGIETDIRNEYSLQCDYIFYPAQFWPHKNHVFILEALYLLEKEHGRQVGAIFTGGETTGTREYVKDACRKLNLEDRVRFTGFVENSKVPDLYRQSLALVMPSYFGPTNLPPLEAFELGVPVIYSDGRGPREQLGDAALFVELNDPGTLTASLIDLMDNESLRSDLISKGYRKTRETTDETRIATLTSIICEFKIKRKCWL